MHRWNKNKKHTQPNFSGRMCFFVCYLGKESVPLLLQCFLNSHSRGNGSADHGMSRILDMFNLLINLHHDKNQPN